MKKVGAIIKALVKAWIVKIEVTLSLTIWKA